MSTPAGTAEDSPGSSWSLTESASTLWKRNKQEWGMRRQEKRHWKRSVTSYMDSSSLLAHRLSVEPSLRLTMIRFSLGLVSGGVKPSAKGKSSLIHNIYIFFKKAFCHKKLCVGVLYLHIPDQTARQYTSSSGWLCTPVHVCCPSCRSRDSRQSKDHTSLISSVSGQKLYRKYGG